MIDEEQVRIITKKVLDEENLLGFIKIFEKEHNLFRGSHDKIQLAQDLNIPQQVINLVGGNLNFEQLQDVYITTKTTGDFIQHDAGLEKWKRMAALTQGSVVFVGPNGYFIQDNTNFIWDNTAKILQVPGLSIVELRFYDSGHYVGFEAPTLSADLIWVLPAVDGGPNQVIYTDGSKNLAFGSFAGNVTATANFGTDNVLIRSDGTLKVLQHSGITIDNSNNISCPGRIIITKTDDVDLVGVSGVLITGGDGTGQHLAFDDNEIMSKSNATTAGNLYLNHQGGTIYMLGAFTLTPTTITGGAQLFIEAGATGIYSQTIKNDTSAVAANVYISAGDYKIYRSTSSKKYKHNIKDLELDSSLIYNLPPVSFDSLGVGDKGKRFVGLLAEDVEKIYPDLIDYNEKNEVENYDNQMLMTLMLAEVQKHEARIKELEEQLNN